MKFVNIVSLFALLASTAEGKIGVNGKFCDLEVEITCELTETGQPCDSFKTFDTSTCKTDPDQGIGAKYTMTYTNGGSKKIKFRTGINPESDKGNPFTFGIANKKDVNIQKGKRLKGNETRRYKASRTLFPCSEPGSGPRKTFVAELQMNGFIVGNKNDKDYACSARDFYKHQFKFTTPTPAPTAVPTAGPTLAPTAVPIAGPTLTPTAFPTTAPTLAPTAVPTTGPTSSPTLAPTAVPTAGPTLAPTSVPTAGPTLAPTAVPTAGPTLAPTALPTAGPTSSPTVAPTEGPTVAPTEGPTLAPTTVPTGGPTAAPSGKGGKGKGSKKNDRELRVHF